MIEKSPVQRAKLSLQVQKVMLKYLQMDSWTPVMAAMLFAGLAPKVGCTALPADGAVGLDGSVIRGTQNASFSAARRILEEWNDNCEDNGEFPTQLTPEAFMLWCIEGQVQERLSVLRPLPWITVFKKLFGNGPQSDLIDFGLATYIANTAEPLQTILDRIDALGRASTSAQSPMPPQTSATVAAYRPTQKGVPTRAYLTTEELASALHVEPESIHKARSKNGHYCGIQPIKLPNRRLAWPIDAIERITKIQ